MSEPYSVSQYKREQNKPWNETQMALQRAYQGLSSMLGKPLSHKDACIIFLERYRQWLSSQESELKNILGKDGHLSLTVSTGMVTLSADTSLKSRTTTTEEIQTLVSSKPQP